MDLRPTAFATSLSAALLIAMVSDAQSDPALYGNTLTCVHSLHGNQSVLRVFITKERAFLYHSYRGAPSKGGIVYEFGKTSTGMAAGVNPYQSSAQIGSGYAELSVELENRTCRICDGKTIMISDTTRVAGSGANWTATRTYRQWFPDGTTAAVPSGSEQYSCTIRKGRVGVGR